jgi:C-terminal processing protease CtpA/Prc
MKSIIKVVAALAATAVLLSTAFAGGMLFERFVADDMGGAAGATSATGGGVDDAVAEVADIIRDLALEPSSDTSLTAGAITGMLESLEDSHAVYFDPKHFEYFNEQSMGSSTGSGSPSQTTATTWWSTRYSRAHRPQWPGLSPAT